MDRYLITIPYILVVYIIYKKLKDKELSEHLVIPVKVLMYTTLTATLFMAIGIYFDRYDIRNLMLIIPIIIILGYASYIFFKDLLLYSIKVEGTFVDFDYVFSTKSKKFHNLKFKYFYDNKNYVSFSNDQYQYETVQFRYTRGNMYDIHLNKEDYSKFTLNRIQYAYYSLVAIIPCVGLIVYGINLLF